MTLREEASRGGASQALTATVPFDHPCCSPSGAQALRRESLQAPLWAGMFAQPSRPGVGAVNVAQDTSLSHVLLAERDVELAL